MSKLASLAEAALLRGVEPMVRAGGRLNLTRYHLRQARLCEGILAQIAAGGGGSPDAATSRRAEEYAASVLGWRGYAPWLRVYSVIAGGFREGWIPDNYYSQVVVPAINGGYRETAQIRQFGIRLFGAEVVPDAVHVMRGRFHTPAGTPIPPEELPRHLFARDERSAFKANWSGLGEAVRVLRRDEFAPGTAWPDGVFQHFIEAHPELRRFQGDATSTLRLTTVLNASGRPELRAAYIRLPRLSDSFVKSRTLTRVPLDLETGAFAERALLSNWSFSATHPDTGAAFAGARMPAFAASRELVLHCHASAPFVGCVGWDIAVDATERPWLLEWNAMHNDIKASEMTVGPCFTGLGWENLWRNAQ
jgi:hypothetical protein